MKKLLICAGLALSWSVSVTVSPANAEATLAEQRLSQELTAAVTEGSILHLGEGRESFLAIFSNSQTRKSRGGIILLHDVNGHADWPDVIAPLRRRMTQYGWNTLSIQLPQAREITQALKRPPAANDSAFTAMEQEIDRRIQAAIAYCHDQKIVNIVLLGHQFGAIMASRFAAKYTSQENSINALVAISLFSPVMESDIFLNQDTLKEIHTAFLEVTPNQSSLFTLDIARKREAFMKRSGHDKYRQIHIIGADYTFSGAEITLASRIEGWLARMTTSVKIQQPDQNAAPALNNAPESLKPK